METTKPIEFRIEEQGDNYIFYSNATLNNESLEYDLNSVKEIFELNPIEKKEVIENGVTKTLSFDISYDVPNEKFLLQLKYDNEIEDSRDITLEEMLNMLIDAHQNNTYITNCEILSQKVNDMLNVKTDNLLREGYIPNTEFILKGEGIIKLNNEKIAIFDRAYIIPEKDQLVGLEIIGDLPEGLDVAIEFVSTLGVKFTFPNVRISKDTYDKEKNKVLEISYASFIDRNNLVDNLIIDKVEPIEFNQSINTLSEGLIRNYEDRIKSLIKTLIDEINKNSDEEMIKYIKEKKNILYSTSEEDYLENQVDEIFDDIDF